MAQDPRTQHIPNVRRWSKEVPAADFTLADLDVYVLKEHPDIVAAMGRERVPDRRQLVDLAILVAMVVAPLTAAFAWGGQLPTNQGIDVDPVRSPATFAGLWFLLALPGPYVVGWRWWRSGRHRDALETFAVVFAAVLGVGVLTRIARETTTEIWPPELVVIPIWLTVVPAVLVAVLVAVASRGRRVDLGRHFRVVGPGDVDEVRRLVGLLDPKRHERLLDERRRALARLRERGLVDSRESATVADLPLGWSPTLAAPGRQDDVRPTHAPGRSSRFRRRG